MAEVCRLWLCYLHLQLNTCLWFWWIAYLCYFPPQHPFPTFIRPHPTSYTGSPRTMPGQPPWGVPYTVEHYRCSQLYNSATAICRTVAIQQAVVAPTYCSDLCICTIAPCITSWSCLPIFLLSYSSSANCCMTTSHCMTTPHCMTTLWAEKGCTEAKHRCACTGETLSASRLNGCFSNPGYVFYIIYAPTGEGRLKHVLDWIRLMSTVAVRGHFHQETLPSVAIVVLLISSQLS
jgi:hypothetical protein